MDTPATSTRNSAAFQADFQRDGFLIVPDILTAAECDELKTEAKRVLAEHAQPKASVYVHVAAVSDRFRALAEDPRVLNVLEALMPEGVMFLSDKIVYKAADKTFPTPWHIDRFYWRDTRPKLSVWIPLDDASAENGTLTVVPGSQKRDWKMATRSQASGEFGEEVGEVAWREADVVTCAIPRGTAVFFSDALVHGSTPNTARRERFAIISTYHAPAPDEPFDRDFPARKVLRSRRG